MKMKTPAKPKAAAKAAPKKPAPKAAAKTATPKAPKAPKEKSGFGIQYLSEKLGVEPHIVRQRLRSRKIEKVGTRYEWATAADADKVVTQLKTKPKGDDAKADA